MINMETKTYLYKDYKNFMFDNGYKNKSVILDQIDKDNVCEKIEISSPKWCSLIRIYLRNIISVDKGYLFGLIILDKNGKEIPDDTKIRISKDDIVATLIILETVNYSDIKMSNENGGYKINRMFEIGSNFLLIIDTPFIFHDIPKENIKFKIEIDLWEKEEII